MTDEPTAAVDLDRTAANKAAVRAFVEDALVGHRLDRVSAHVDPATYYQHNPRVGDGPAAMVAAFRKLDAVGTPHRYHRIRLLLGEGSFVLAASEGAIGGTPTAYYDLFRLADGRIAEHWDVVQAIPPRSEWKNANGKF